MDLALLARANCQPGYIKTAGLASPNPFLATEGGNRFGISQAFNERYLFVADSDAVSTNIFFPSGAVYVYYLNDNHQWVFTQMLTTGGNQDAVGSVNIKSQGDFLFVSAVGTPLGDPQQDVLNKDFTGALLIYRRSDTRIPGTGAYQWELAQILDRHTPGLQGLTPQTSPSTNGAFFGFRHAADVENGWLLVAAPFQTVLDPLTNAPILDAGAVFAFCLNRLTGHWELSQMITNPESVSLGMFGGNLSISNGHAFISDTGLGSFPQINLPAATRNGTVYAFRLSERRRLWRYTQKLSGDDSLALAQQLEFGDGFGASLSIDGRWAVIGAPFESFSAALEAQFQGAAYFFRLFDGKWIRTQKVVSDDFTTPFKQTSYFTAEIKGRVAIVSDAHRSGSAGEEQGGILVYYRKRGIWHPYPTIFDPNGAPFQNFGASSSLSDIQFVNGRFRIFFSGATSLFFFVPFQPSFVSVFEGVCQ